MENGVPGPGPVKCMLLLIVTVDTTIRKQIQDKIANHEKCKKETEERYVCKFKI